MPEHQASSSSPPPRQSPGTNSSSDRDATVPPPPEAAKRAYLSLLPPLQLIDLILAIDANRETLIFPHDLDDAIKALQRSHKPPSPPPSKDPPATAAIVVKALPVQPPQYNPPVHYYPYTHTPYYPPQVHRPQTTAHIGPPSAPPRHPLFTSAPLMRDPNKPPPPPPPPPVSSRDDPNAMPSYEEMIVEAIMDVGDEDGTVPKVLFTWMASHYPLQQNFRPSASQALHKALKRGRLQKLGGRYRLNPSWGGGPTTSKRATRRPTANRALSPHSLPLTHPPPPALSHLQQNAYGAQVHPPPNPPYGFPPQYTQQHTPLLPASHPSVPVPVGENGGVESDDLGEAEDVGLRLEDEALDVESGTQPGGGGAEEIRHSLVRLAAVLRKIARSGGAG